MEMTNDGTEYFMILRYCEAGDERRSIYSLLECPLGYKVCNDFCKYFGRTLIREERKWMDMDFHLAK